MKTPSMPVERASMAIIYSFTCLVIPQEARMEMAVRKVVMM